MRTIFIVLWMMYFSAAPAVAQVNVNIGINLAAYPELVQVPGYPVYYAPRQKSNFFFFDGMYWVYQGDNWYASSWYNGPWEFVGPESVPLFVLRIPVRYYRNPPAYFYGWRRAAPPRWGDHWGNDWAQNRRGWDQWNRHSAPAPAPLPVYQKKYSGDRYPQGDRQHAIQQQNYRYRPRDALVREHHQAPTAQRSPAPSRQERAAPPERNQPLPQGSPRTTPSPRQPGMPEAPRSSNAPNSPNSPHAPDSPGLQHAQPPQHRGEAPQRAAPAPEQQRAPVVREQPQPRPAPAQHEQPAPSPDRHSAPQAQGRGQGQAQGREHEQNEGHGQGRNK